MVRSFLIYLSKAVWMQNMVKNFPIARKVALRFVAGEKLEDAIEVVKELNNEGKFATLDLLGEDTDTIEIAEKITLDIINAINKIFESSINSGISLKLNQIGLGLNSEICSQNLIKILTVAKKNNIFVRVDIEDSPVVDITFSILNSMRNDHGFENVGAVLQSYLFRTVNDLDQLLKNGFRIRMVKGAYKELEDISYVDKSENNENFDLLVSKMLSFITENNSPPTSSNGIWPPIVAVATHDPQRVNHAKEVAEKLEIDKSNIEFQMLFGIERELQTQLVAEGFPVRIYVPFGDQWYPYFMRRLAERPANLLFFLTSLFRK